MVDTNDSQRRDELENQVWSAIAAFEQIVQTIPNDRVSLEALAHAYEQIGDLSRSRDYLTRLANVLVDEKDREALGQIRERLEQYALSDAAAHEAAQRVAAFLGEGQAPEAVPAAPAEPEHPEAAPEPAEAERFTSHVAAELSFAWALLQAGELSEEEYASVAQDLSELSSSSTAVTISVLHALHGRGNRNVERITAYAARDTGTPLIPVGLFDIQEKILSLLPVDFAIRHGALPFETVGNDVLVAVMNPYHKALKKKIESTIGRKCHFFVALPGDFDGVMERITGQSSAKKAPTP